MNPQQKEAFANMRAAYRLLAIVQREYKKEPVAHNLIRLETAVLAYNRYWQIFAAMCD